MKRLERFTRFTQGKRDRRNLIDCRARTSGPGTMWCQHRRNGGGTERRQPLRRGGSLTNSDGPSGPRSNCRRKGERRTARSSGSSPSSASSRDRSVWGRLGAMTTDRDAAKPTPKWSRCTRPSSWFLPHHRTPFGGTFHAPPAESVCGCRASAELRKPWSPWTN
jgi:hypothetical protein